MPERREIYKCEECGNIVEVLDGGGADLVCCGKDMVLLEGSTTDEGKEKHVPVIESVDGGIKVKVGSTPHPMEEKHYIEWIEIIDGDTSTIHYLKPGQSPEALFKGAGQNVTAREYCNVHGMWKS